MVLIGKIVIVLLQVLGLFPFYHDEKINRFVRMKASFQVYRYLITIFTSTIALYMCKHYYDNGFFLGSQRGSTLIVQVCNMAQQLSFYLVAMLSLLTVILNSKLFHEILNESCELYDLVKSLKRDPKAEKRQIRTLIIVSLLGIPIYISSMWATLEHFNFRWFEILALSNSIFSQYCAVLGFLMINLFLSNVYRIINLEIKYCSHSLQLVHTDLKKFEVMSRCCDICDRMDRVSVIQLRTYQVCQKVASFMGVWLLFSLLILFTGFLTRVMRLYVFIMTDFQKLTLKEVFEHNMGMVLSLVVLIYVYCLLVLITYGPDKVSRKVNYPLFK